MWTPEAIKDNKVHRIHSIEEQKSLIREGLLTSASINPPGRDNPYVGAGDRIIDPMIALAGCSTQHRSPRPANFWFSAGPDASK